MGSITNQNNAAAMWEINKNLITHSVQPTVGERKKNRRKIWFDDKCEGVLKLRHQARQRKLQERNIQKYTVQKSGNVDNKSKK